MDYKVSFRLHPGTSELALQQSKEASAVATAKKLKLIYKVKCWIGKECNCSLTSWLHPPPATGSGWLEQRPRWAPCSIRWRRTCRRGTRQQRLHPSHHVLPQTVSESALQRSEKSHKCCQNTLQDISGKVSSMMNQPDVKECDEVVKA